MVLSEYRWISIYDHLVDNPVMLCCTIYKGELWGKNTSSVRRGKGSPGILVNTLQCVVDGHALNITFKDTWTWMRYIHFSHWKAYDIWQNSTLWSSQPLPSFQVSLCLGVDPSLYKGKIKWNEADQKFFAAWMGMLLTSLD
jgi:hypothetical protein